MGLQAQSSMLLGASFSLDRKLVSVAPEGLGPEQHVLVPFSMIS